MRHIAPKALTRPWRAAAVLYIRSNGYYKRSTSFVILMFEIMAILIFLNYSLYWFFQFLFHIDFFSSIFAWKNTTKRPVSAGRARSLQHCAAGASGRWGIWAAAPGSSPAPTDSPALKGAGGRAPTSSESLCALQQAHKSAHSRCVTFWHDQQTGRWGVRTTASLSRWPPTVEL